MKVEIMNLPFLPLMYYCFILCLLPPLCKFGNFILLANTFLYFFDWNVNISFFLIIFIMNHKPHYLLFV